MIVCVLSDTHNNHRATEQAVSEIARLHPKIVIHCGDLTDPALFALFDRHELAAAQFYFVYGNNDHDTYGIDQACRARGIAAGPFHEIIAAGRAIYACHGHRGFRDMAIGSGNYDVVFSGHSHVAEDRRSGTTRVVNPGALYRARRYSFAHYDAAADELSFVDIQK